MNGTPILLYRIKYYTIQHYLSQRSTLAPPLLEEFPIPSGL